MPLLIDLKGKNIGMWTVLIYAGKLRWKCLCNQCHEVKTVSGKGLRDGTSTRCFDCSIRNRTTHGHSVNGHVSPTYSSFMSMWDRCTRPKNNDYAMYGGAGIKVCERWKHFSNFLKDMGERPKGCQLDRINNLGNYEPSNCRWATPSQNCRNKKNNRWVRLNGERMVVIEAAKRMGVSRGKLGSYLRKRGWPNIDLSTIHWKPAFKWTDDQKRNMAKEGLSPKELMKRYGLSQTHAYRVAHHYKEW